MQRGFGALLEQPYATVSSLSSHAHTGGRLWSEFCTHRMQNWRGLRSSPVAAGRLLEPTCSTKTTPQFSPLRHADRAVDLTTATERAPTRGRSQVTGSWGTVEAGKRVASMASISDSSGGCALWIGILLQSLAVHTQLNAPTHTPTLLSNPPTHRKRLSRPNRATLTRPEATRDALARRRCRSCRCPGTRARRSPAHRRPCTGSSPAACRSRHS